MNDLAELMSDKVSIFDENENLIVANILASVSSDSILIGSGDFVIDCDYIIERKLPNNHIEKYRVIDPDFFTGIEGMPAHYNIKVENMKKRKASTSSNNNTVNNYNLSGNSRFYQDSTDHSNNTYNFYTLSQYQEALGRIKSEANQLVLNQSDQTNLELSLKKIENELKKDIPNKEILMTCIEFLPASVMALQSVINLGQMLGFS